MQKALYIARTLLQKGPQTLQEICDGWAEYDARGKSMATSTFYDNRRVLAERFGLLLEQDAEKRYVVTQSSKMERPLLLRMVEGTTTTPLPTAEVWQPLLEEAHKNCQMVRMSYASLRRPAYETTLSPYALHTTAQGRHYVLGMSSVHKEIRTFALERIVALQLLPQHFTPPLRTDFFARSVGAMSGDVQDVATVRLRAHGYLVAYLRAVPLHASQQEVSTGVFEWQVVHDAELLRLLLSFGSFATVLAPDGLRRELRQTLQEMLGKYETE